jgi:hypothetical protein
VVQDRAADVGAGEGWKRGALRRSVQLGGTDQAQHAHLLQILERFGAAAGVMKGQGAHQITMDFHKSVALAQSLGGRRG